MFLVSTVVGSIGAGGIQRTGVGSVYLRNNAWINSSNVNNVVNTSYSAWDVVLDVNSDVYKVRRAPSGSVVPTYTDLMTIDSSGNTYVAGNLGVGVTAAYRHHVVGSSNGILSSMFINTNSGTSAQGRYMLLNDRADASLNQGFMAMYSSTFTGTLAGVTLADMLLLDTGGSSNQGLMLATESAKSIYLVTNSVKRATIDSNGLITLGDTALNGANNYEIRYGRSDASTTLRVGQADVNNMYLGWSRDPTVGNAFGAIGTYGNNNAIKFAAASMTWGAGGTDRMGLTTAAFRPESDGGITLGTSSLPWGQIYSTSTTILTSDRNAKTDISDTPLGLDFIQRLHPVQYKMKDYIRTERRQIDTPVNVTVGNVTTVETHTTYENVTTNVTHKRYHHGLIAQEVAEVLVDLNVSTNDFAGYIDPAATNDTGSKGLRYEEFISPLIKAVQELSHLTPPKWAPGAPTSSVSPCTPGAVQYTEAYLFICVSVDRWSRLALEQSW